MDFSVNFSKISKQYIITLIQELECRMRYFYIIAYNLVYLVNASDGICPCLKSSWKAAIALS